MKLILMQVSPSGRLGKSHTRVFRGGPFDFWGVGGGGGLRKMYLNNLFIFSQVENNYLFYQ